MANESKRELAHDLPTNPGVYQMLDKTGVIIYIGKAKNIKKRVSQYFVAKRGYKTHLLVKEMASIRPIITKTEHDALLLENELIKRHQPRFNILLKDDKTYPYIKITLNEPFPRILITRIKKNDGSKYFGPYTDVIYLRRTLKAIRKIFPVRSCDYFIDQSVIKAKKIDLCLDYHIKKCEGPCEGLVTQKHYNEMIANIISFLHGKTKDSELYIKDQMVLASSQMRYEDAGIFRDQLEAIKEFKKKQLRVNADFDDRDVIALSKENDFGIVVIVRIRNGRITSREKLSMSNLDENDGATIKTVITQFYLNTDFIPSDICVQVLPESIDDLKLWLQEKRRKKVNISVPIKGEKAKQVRLAYQNAKLLLGEWILNKKKRKDLVPKMIQQLQDDLQLKAPPRKIECFDISHLGGTNTVASMVCFVDAKPRKSLYRKYNIKTVEGIDDFASIREVIFRRYKRVKEEGTGLPDLIVVDGGKGQLSMAVSALRELGLDYVPIISLAKKLEEVFVPGYSDAQTIHKQSSGLILLRQLRDEAHRFAIEFHRQKRSKSISHSVFKDIKGIGAKKAQKLLVEYKSTKKIASLSIEEVQNKLNVSDLTAKEIIDKAKIITN